jgi:hypothetical protein
MPTSGLAHAVVAAGFWYDPAQDIIFSRKDAWQRRMGYTWAYDEASAPLHMIIDCEPFYFAYAGKLWMIELWKGQYGLETGAELGVYRDEVGVGLLSFAPRSRFYACVGQADELPMKFTLYRNGNELLRRADSHWWLTGFKWGVFTANTRELTMDVEISFPRKTEMRDAFKQAVRDKGYVTMDRGPFGIAFRFDYPRTQQPGTRSAAEGGAQGHNERLVRGYNNLKKVLRVPSNDPNGFGQLDSLLKAARVVSAAAKKVQDHGAAAAKNLQSLASAASKKFGAVSALANKLPHQASGGANPLQSATAEADGAYRELCAFFDKKVWHVTY